MKAPEQHLLSSWPGNVRELQNIVSRTVLTARGPIIEPEDLKLKTKGKDAEDTWLPLYPLTGWKEAKAILEGRYFENLLSIHDGSVTKAARHAGIARKNL